MAKKEYEALNAQLVEELQVFNQAARKILWNCLCSFVTLLRDLALLVQRLYSTVAQVSAAPDRPGLQRLLETAPVQIGPVQSLHECGACACLCGFHGNRSQIAFCCFSLFSTGS